MIKTKLENELKELKSVKSFKNLSELDANKEKVNKVENLISIMTAISNVIIRRRQRGANAHSINAYKQKLLTDTWRNNELVKRHVEEII